MKLGFGLGIILTAVVFIDEIFRVCLKIVQGFDGTENLVVNLCLSGTGRTMNKTKPKECLIMPCQGPKALRLGLNVVEPWAVGEMVHGGIGIGGRWGNVRRHREVHEGVVAESL